MRKPPDQREAGSAPDPAPTTSVAAKATDNVHGTRPPLRTSCSTGTWPDCAGTGAVALQPCDRRTQWLRRVGYGDLFGRWAA